MSRQDHHPQQDPPAPRVVTVEGGRGRGRMLICCEHASAAIPDDLDGLGLTADQARAHIAWDPGALGLARALAARLDAPLVWAGVSRLVYDLNRPPHAPGAMAVTSEVHSIPGNRGLSAADRQRRTRALYLPFHDRLRREIALRLAAGRLDALVTVHSFTPVWHGQPRAVEVGLIHDSDDRLARALHARLRAGARWPEAPQTAPVPAAPETSTSATDAPETDAPETDAPETDAIEGHPLAATRSGRDPQVAEAPASETTAPATDAPETFAPAASRTGRDPQGAEGRGAGRETDARAAHRSATAASRTQPPGTCAAVSAGPDADARDPRGPGRAWDVRLNEPYSAADGVAHTLALHATPMGLPHVMIELRSDLIATPDAQKAVAATLAPALIAALADLIPAAEEAPPCPAG